MIRVSGLVLTIAITGICIISSSAGYCAEDKGQRSITPDEILQAWQQRQDRIPSARFAWKRSRSDEHRFSLVEETHQLTKDDYYECIFVADNVFLHLPGSPANTFSQVLSRLGGPNLTEGRKSALSKFEKSGAELAPSKDHYIHQRSLTPTSATEVWFPIVTGGNYPKAWRYQLTPSSDRDAQLNLWFQPVADTTGQIALMFVQAPLIAIRPFSPVFGEVQPDRCSLSPLTRTVAGNECLILEETLGSPAHMRSFWVDPQRDFVILRYQGFSDFHLTVQLDFEYDQHPVKGWIPKSWTAIELLSSTKTIRSFASTQDVQMDFDIKTKSMTTELTFPPGTWLVNETAGEQILVQEDKSRQRMASSIGISGAATTMASWESQCRRFYDQWIGQQEQQAGIRTFGWMVLGILAAIGLAALAWFVKKQVKMI